MILYKMLKKSRQRRASSAGTDRPRSGAFGALTRNTVRASFRNRIALFFTLGLAVLFMVIFGELFGGNNFKVTYGVVDNDQSQLSQKFVADLSNVKGATLESGTESHERDRLKHGNIDLVVIIPKGFAEALATGTHIEIQPVQGSTTSQTASVSNQILGDVLTGFEARAAKVPSPPVQLAQPSIESANNITAIDYFLPAMLAYIILQSGINYVAIGLADLRTRKVLRRFRATPVTPVQILGAQIVGGMITVILQLLVLIALGLVVFQAKTFGSWFVAAVPILAGVAAFVGIGFLLTSAARTSEAARGLATMVAFPMMFLSGVFFPITELPGWLQTLVHVLPLTWLTDALHQVMNDGVGLDAIAVDCLVLAAWAAVTFALATWRFRWE